MTIELKVWQYVLSVLVAFEAGLFFMAWWAYVCQGDDCIVTPVPKCEGIEADAAKFMLEGKL